MRASFAPLSLVSIRALRVAAVAPVLCAAACGGEVISGGYGPGGYGTATGAGGGGTVGHGSSTSAATGGSRAAATTSTTSGVPTSSSSGGTACAGPNGTLPASPCTPTVAQACNLPPSACVATADAHASPTFALRIAQLTLTAPSAFTGSGVVAETLQEAVGQHLVSCNLGGQGGLNWLLAFDTLSGTLTTGGALPVGDPTTQPYSFLSGSVPAGEATFEVSPTILTAPVGAACGFASTAGNVNLPIYQPGATPLGLLPLRSLRFHDATLTPDHNCIGAFDPFALDPSDGCAPFVGQRPFTEGGSLDAYIPLQDADNVIIPPLQMSLCVVLSGDSTQWGDGSSPMRCKRGAGDAILFQGDWCAETDAPAGAGCADAVRFSGTFAANGVSVE